MDHYQNKILLLIDDILYGLDEGNLKSMTIRLWNEITREVNDSRADYITVASYEEKGFPHTTYILVDKRQNHTQLSYRGYDGRFMFISGLEPRSIVTFSFHCT